MLKKIDWGTVENLSRKQLQTLGFQLWDEESGLMLIPAKFYKDIPQGFHLQSINGRKVVVGKDYVDDDQRSGLLAYGIVPGSAQ